MLFRSSGAPPAQFSETCPERGRGAWTSPQPRGETKRRTLTQPAAPLRAGGETLGPPGLPLPAALPPTLTCSRKSPNTDTISTPEACGQEARPLVTAAQVGAHSGMWGDRRKGGRAPRAAEAPRPPPQAAPPWPRTTLLSPRRVPRFQLRALPPIPGPQGGARAPLPGWAPSPGRAPAPSAFPYSGDREEGWGGAGAGRGGRTGRRSEGHHAVSEPGSTSCWSFRPLPKPGAGGG